MTINIKAKGLANQTSNAYMCNSYGAHWIKCASLLLDGGFSIEQAEQVLRSKHMRWANDASDEATLYAFAVYLVKHLDSVSKDAARWAKEESKRTEQA